MINPATGRAALFDENGTSGSPSDPNATRNKPLDNPYDFLSRIYFHSDFDYLEVAASGTITINHAAVTPPTPPVWSAQPSAPFSYKAGVTSHLINSHGLGYAPFAIIASGSNILWPGMPIQFSASNGGRFLTPYVTSSQLRIYEWSMAKNAVAAVTRTYSYIVFRRPRTASGKILMDFNPTTGTVTMGKGKFDSTRRYLQVVPGGSPLGFHRGRCIDLDNGAPRFINPDGSVYDPIPSSSGLSLTLYNMAPTSYASMKYEGSFAGVPGIQVQAP